jgi:dienelactone hydrolase
MAGLTLVITLAIGVAACEGQKTPQLSFPGPLPTQRWDASFGQEWPISVFYPDTAVAAPGPLIVFTTGWNQSRAAYFGYATQLAQWGYVCVVRAYPTLEIGPANIGPIEEHTRQVSLLIDWCTEENLRADSPLFGRVDTGTVGAAGHSHGGKVSVVAALYDPRIDAIVDLDGNNDSDRVPLAGRMHEINAPILWLSSGDESRCTGILGSRGEVLYPYASPPTEEVTILGASHIAFLESSQGLNVIGQVVCGGGDKEQQAVRDIAYRYLIAWFNVYLKGDRSFETYFRGHEAARDVARGDVAIRARFPQE